MRLLTATLLLLAGQACLGEDVVSKEETGSEVGADEGGKEGSKVTEKRAPIQALAVPGMNTLEAVVTPSLGAAPWSRPLPLEALRPRPLLNYMPPSPLLLMLQPSGQMILLMPIAPHHMFYPPPPLPYYHQGMGALAQGSYLMPRVVPYPQQQIPRAASAGFAAQQQMLYSLSSEATTAPPPVLGAEQYKG